MKSELEIVTKGMRTVPVDVEGIIEDLGIAYEARPMAQGESGVIEHENGKYKITVNSNEGRQRQRFTAAHELSHYLLHRDMLVKNGGLNRHSDMLFDSFAQGNPPQPFKPVHEVQANQLAAEILMPRDKIKELYNPDLDNVLLVAQSFRVSRSAMEIRLKVLGLRPV